MVAVQLVDGLDVREHLCDDLLREHVVRPILIVHLEVEHLVDEMKRRHVLPLRR